MGTTYAKCAPLIAGRKFCIEFWLPRVDDISHFSDTFITYFLFPYLLPAPAIKWKRMTFRKHTQELMV